MLFSEYYSEYYACVAEILGEALRGTLTRESMLEITRRRGFAETMLTIPAHLKDESWPLLTRENRTPLHHLPPHPVTLLQKRWLKTLLADPRIRLFEVSDRGLQGIEPLFDPRKIVWYDRYADGDPYEDPEYIGRFRLLLKAVKDHFRVQVTYMSRHGTRNDWTVMPFRLEYSPADDKFRLLCRSDQRDSMTLNLKRISACRLAEPFDPEKYPAPYPGNESVTLEILDERNALERAMLQFSDLAKRTERTGESTYRMTLQYRPEDRTELLIRILSFGPLLKVTEPESFRGLIQERISGQLQRNLF